MQKIGRRLCCVCVLGAAMLVFAPSVEGQEETSAAVQRLLQSDRPLAERFAVPPADARILKILHGLPDDAAEQDQRFDALIKQGFGGVVTNVAFSEYMASEVKWEAFIRGVHAAKQRGMCLWLYDECGYPSGSAGGITLREHPEYEARGLYVADAATEGGRVTLPLPPGTLFRAVALPIRDGAASLEGALDLGGFVAEGKLAWEAPQGSWHVFVFTEDRLYEGTHAAVSLAYKLPYINLIPPEPTARFLEVTHAEYARRLGKNLGKYFVSTFTDEPSLMSLFMRGQDHRVLPWGSNLASEFARRRGYAMAPGLPLLLVEGGASGRRYRYDFWKTVGELVSENFFGQIQTWCQGHNILSGGHLLCEESFLADIALYGDFFRCLRRLDAPSMDCLTSLPDDVPWHVARLVSSAAELEGRTITMSESSDHAQRYRPEGDGRPVREVSEWEIRGASNRLILNGINTITSYYSFSGLSDEELNRLNVWIGRCCTMLRGGRQVSDIALLYPVDTAWVRFTPSRHWTEESPAAAHRVEKTFGDAEEALYTARRDFTHIDAQTLLDGQVENGVLKYRDFRWRVLVLPDADTLPLAAWEKVAVFSRSGGAVIALTSLPANSEGEFPSARVMEISKAVFGEVAGPQIMVNGGGGAGVFLPAGSEALLPVALDALIEGDGKISDAGAPIRVTHRRIEGHEIYFIINDSGGPWEGTLDVPAAGAVEQWDPATGQATVMAQGAGVGVRLEAYGGMFYRFAEAVLPARKQTASGRFPALGVRALPETAPVVSKGEYVAAAIEAVPSLSTAGNPVWRASGRISKTGVDTFCFAVYHFAQPVNMQDAAYVTFEAWLPEQQGASVPLLLILCDSAGVDYLADTGVPMSGSGHYVCHVPLNRFRRAGWCKVTDRPLDTASISAIRLGWGGYKGCAEEQVAFCLTGPRLTIYTPD